MDLPCWGMMLSSQKQMETTSTINYSFAELWYKAKKQYNRIPKKKETANNHINKS